MSIAEYYNNRLVEISKLTNISITTLKETKQNT